MRMTKRKHRFALRFPNKGTYFLSTLLTVFGVFYFIGTIFKSDNLFSSWLSTYTDLWANLFASMIVIIGVERIVNYTHLEKNKTSVTYVRERVTKVLLDLMRSMKIPDDWRERIEKEDNWDDFRVEMLNSKEKALQKLERIVDSYSFILEAELRNDLLNIVHLLREFRLYSDFPNGKLWSELVDSANLSLVLASQIKEIMQRHRLASHVGTLISFKREEMPKISWGKMEIFTSPSKHVNYDEWVKSTIAFRDECYGKATSEPK